MLKVSQIPKPQLCLYLSCVFDLLKFYLFTEYVVARRNLDTGKYFIIIIIKNYVCQ